MNSWKQKALQEIKQQTEVFEKKAGQKKFRKNLTQVTSVTNKRG